jgi:hypothetical protein
MKDEDKEAAEKPLMELAMERAHLGAQYTGDKVGHEATYSQRAMGTILDATVDRIGICAKLKR